MTTPTWYISPIAIHPWETLLEALEHIWMSQADFATRTGLAKETINRIINWTLGISHESAIKFENVLWISADFWMSYQHTYDRDIARIKEEERLAEEAKMMSDFKNYDVLVKIGYVKQTNNNNERAQEILKFLWIDSFWLVDKIYPALYRKSPGARVNLLNLAIWKRLGEKEAKKITLKELDLKWLKKKIPEIRALTLLNIADACKKLIEICADHWVALVYTHFFSKTYTNGAVRYFNKSNILIQIAPRFQKSDTFWFTFFHELWHVFLHKNKLDFTDMEKMEDNEQEQEADAFACNTLIPKEYLEKLEELKRWIESNTIKSQVNKFSEKIWIHPWIVAWRIAKETWNWYKLNSLRESIEMSSC